MPDRWSPGGRKENEEGQSRVVGYGFCGGDCLPKGLWLRIRDSSSGPYLSSLPMISGHVPYHPLAISVLMLSVVIHMKESINHLDGGEKGIDIKCDRRQACVLISVAGGLGLGMSFHTI